MNEKEKAVLYALTNNPGLLEKHFINPAMFEGIGRDIFNELQRQFLKSQSFDEPIALDTLNLKASRFHELFDGCYRFDESRFEFMLKEIEAEKLSKEILVKLDKEMKAELKTGTIDKSKIAGIEAMLKKRSALLETQPQIPMSVCLGDVPEEEPTWLWKNYIPCDAITLITGDPDAGKSWWCMDMTSRVTRGGAWPDGTRGGEPKNVYYMTYEDSLTKTVKKRVRLLGGDVNRVHCYNSKNPMHLMLGDPQEREGLENELRRLNIIDGALLVIDPILDFTGSTNPNAVEAVRELLTPIIAMLERLHIACLMVGHLNKDQLKQAMYRAGGSTAGWIGKSRATYLIGRNQEERAKRYAFRIKSNWAWPEPRNMEFEIINNKLIFQFTEEDVNEVLNPTKGRRPEQRNAGIAWLREKFEDREEISSTEIELMRKGENPCSKHTLDNLKEEAGFMSDRTGPGGSWIWKRKETTQ